MTESKKKAIADLKLLESKAYLDGDIELAQEYRILIGIVNNEYEPVNFHNNGASTLIKTN